MRDGSKITLMGQNGAGKSTIFKMITGELKPHDGRILITAGKHIAIAKQVMSPDDKEKTIAEYFRTYSRSDAHNIDRDIQEVLDAVNFLPPKNIDVNDLWTDYLQPLLHDYIRGMYNESSLMDSFKVAYFGNDDESAEN